MRYLIALLMLFSAANVSAKTVICNQCDVPQDYYNQAKVNIVLTEASNPPIYVVNQSAGLVKKFDTISASRSVMERDVESAVWDYLNFVISQNGTVVELPAVESAAASANARTTASAQAASQNGMPENAYEMVEYPQLSENAGAYLKTSGWGQVNDFVRFLSAVNPISGFNPGAISMTLRARMSDGASALFVYNSDTQTFERMEGQTRDSDGNIVAEDKEDLITPGTTRTYSFSDNQQGMQNYTNFIQRAQMLGVPITGDSGWGGTVTVGCSGVACQVHVQHNQE